MFYFSVLQILLLSVWNKYTTLAAENESDQSVINLYVVQNDIDDVIITVKLTDELLTAPILRSDIFYADNVENVTLPVDLFNISLVYLGKLNTCTTYTIAVMVSLENETTISEWIELKRPCTRETAGDNEVYPKKPQNLRIVSSARYKTILAWDVPEHFSFHDADSYVVTFTDLATNTSNIKTFVKWGNLYAVDVYGMYPCTNYSVEVRVHFTNGTSSSVTKDLETPKAGPHSAKMREGKALSYDSISLLLVPAVTGCPPTGYGDRVIFKTRRNGRIAENKIVLSASLHHGSSNFRANCTSFMGTTREVKRQCLAVLGADLHPKSSTQL